MATKTRELADFILEEGIGGDADIAIQSKPHIIPGVLYPAVAGKLLDGTTALSAVTTGPIVLLLHLVNMVQYSLTEGCTTTQTSKEASLLKTLELAHTLGVRGISLNQYNYWNRRLQLMVQMFIQ